MGKRGGTSPTNLWRPVLAAALCAVLVGATGCRDIVAAPPCMPPAYSVTPSAATPGDRVTVSAADAACDARYGQGAQIQVTVRDAAGSVVLEDLAPMTDDGGFTHVFTVPPATAPGEAAVVAFPHALDWCDDTGVNNRAAGSSQALVLVSCAEPVVSLVVLAP